MSCFTIQCSTEDALSFLKERVTKIGGMEIEKILRHTVQTKIGDNISTKLVGMTVVIRGKPAA